MKLILALALCFTVTLANKYEDAYLELANAVNEAKTSWTAGYNERFAGMDWADIKALLGAKLDQPIAPEDKKFVEVTAAIPATFDVRDQWPVCKAKISEIRNQAQCGSCWAVSAAITATDRTCIASNGATSVDLSQQDVLACCGRVCGNGCEGGYPIQAMKYWASTGLVTGGNYGDRTTCAPYSISPTAPSATTPACVKSCQSSYKANTWPNDKHFATSGYSVTGGAAAIQQEILNHGSVQAGFTVYADFMNYRSGVYHHVTGREEGGHAVTIIGWGTENGTPYWLVKNQWDVTWGDKGYFKIRRGNNECGFEAGVVAGVPKQTNGHF